MAVCTFFGHRNCPLSVKPKLRSVLAELIEQRERGYVLCWAAGRL